MVGSDIKHQNGGGGQHLPLSGLGIGHLVPISPPSATPSCTWADGGMLAHRTCISTAMGTAATRGPTASHPLSLPPAS